LLGAKVVLVSGSIKDCGREMREHLKDGGWFDVSTLCEPYRLEGKKTMAYEVVEQLGGRVPNAMICPTGGGTGLIGMWKAFAEMEQLGWTGGPRPRLFAVQARAALPSFEHLPRVATEPRSGRVRRRSLPVCECHRQSATS